MVFLTYLDEAEELCEGYGESVVRDEASDPKGEYGDEVDNEPSFQIPTKGYTRDGGGQRERGGREGREREGRGREGKSLL